MVIGRLFVYADCTAECFPIQERLQQTDDIIALASTNADASRLYLIESGKTGDSLLWHPDQRSLPAV